MFFKNFDNKVILHFSITEFCKPRNTGVFEIKLGSKVIFETEYHFKFSTFEEIKDKILLSSINLSAVKYDDIVFNNISEYGIRCLKSLLEK